MAAEAMSPILCSDRLPPLTPRRGAVCIPAMVLDLHAVALDLSPMATGLPASTTTRLTSSPSIELRALAKIEAAGTAGGYCASKRLSAMANQPTSAATASSCHPARIAICPVIPEAGSPATALSVQRDCAQSKKCLNDPTG